MAVENWAESATIVIPQPIVSASVRSGGPPNVRPSVAAHAPERAIAAIVSVVRPHRSETAPPAQQPAPPAAMTTNAATLALRPAELPPPLVRRLSARKRPIHAHIA